MLHDFTMQKNLGSVISKLILIAQRKMSGSYKSGYRIRALVCLLQYACPFFPGLLSMRSLSCEAHDKEMLLFILGDEWS